MSLRWLVLYTLPPIGWGKIKMCSYFVSGWSSRIIQGSIKFVCENRCYNLLNIFNIAGNIGWSWDQSFSENYIKISLVKDYIFILFNIPLTSGRSRIFQTRGCQPSVWGQNWLFGKIFHENERNWIEKREGPISHLWISQCKPNNVD